MRITSLRTGHMRIMEHSYKFNWGRQYGCKCGYPDFTLRYLLCDCALFSRGRNRMLAFLDGVNFDTNDPVINIRRAVLTLTQGMHIEIPKFFKQSKLII